MKTFCTLREEDLCYEDFWNRIGTSMDNALSMMDGSPNEEGCQLTGQYMAGRISNALLLNQNDVVLEIGCGIGRIGREIAPLCSKWFGVDISSNLIELSRKRMEHLTNVGFHALDKASLDYFRNDFFDKAYSHAVFIHMDKEDLFLYLKEIARVLKPGGLLYFDTWNLKNEVGWERWMMEVETWDQSDQKGRKHVSRNQFSTPEEVSLYVQRAGLRELLSFPDSFWIQEIAIKSGGKDAEQDIEEIVHLIHQREDRIVVNETLIDLFHHHLRLLKGESSPADFHRFIWNRMENEEVSLYRRWFSALWKKNEEKWGPVPQAGSEKGI